MKSKMGSSGTTTTNNTDFQSELLRMNGALQASITELRYHCEVYRLSLKSICKVLASVQKEQDARLRYLTTSRPSFQSYLLNLSQRQALDRIKNVVRKASTFINGYSLVDKQQFQPPPPKLLRCSGAENKTAPTTSTTKLTDGSRTGWVSKYSSGGTSAAPMILPVIAEEGEETSANKEKVGDDDGSAEAASSKNNNGKVERKHSSRRRSRGGEEKNKKTLEKSKSKKSKSRTSSKSSHKHSSSASVSGDAKRGRINSVGGNDDDRSSGHREIKKSQSEKGKMQSKATRKNSFSVTDPISMPKGEDRKKLEKQTRSKSITPSRNHHHDNRHHHNHHRHYHHRYQLINSRTIPSPRVDEKLEDENDDDEGGEIFCVSDELNKSRGKQQSPLVSQFGGSVANRIPPLLSIATCSSSAIKLNKTFGTSHVNEKLRTAEARRVRRPSKEKQDEGRRISSSRNNNNISDSQNKERETKAISRSRASRGSICSIRLKEVHAKRTLTTNTTHTRRWGNTSAITAGYKVRESLAVLRNRNSGSGNTHQGQGVVARKYLFSSHKSRNNNFKLNSSTTVSTASTVVEKVRRVQLNGNNGSRYNNIGTFCGVSLNEDKPYGASRKKATNTGSSNGSVN